MVFALCWGLGSSKQCKYNKPDEFNALSLIACSWTKHLPKSGKVFNDVLAHLRSLDLHNLATRYAELQELVIKDRLNVLAIGPQLTSSSRGRNDDEQSDVLRGESLSDVNMDTPGFFAEGIAHLADDAASNLSS